jgi:type IV secretory pathway TrbD component
MPNWLLALVLKPFFALLYGLTVWGLCYLVWRFLPDGKLKTVLLRPIRLHRKQRVEPDLRQIGLRRQPGPGRQR